MGWATWCTDNGVIPCYDDYCDEAEIRSVGDAMASNGLRELGYNYVLLDDCWGGGRDNVTHLIYPDPARFPSGMKALADYLHAKGLKLGLYTDVGETTCKGGRPGSWPYYTLDAQTFASWGIDYVKMDWCHSPGQTAQELYSNFSLALNKTGHPMVFSICEWGKNSPWEWAPPISNLWRSGPDHVPVWWDPYYGQDPGTAGGTSQIIQHFGGLSKFSGPGQWNDPDFLMPGYFWEFEKDQVTEFSFWCLFAAPLIVATDVRELSDKQVILNKEAISIDQDPLGIQGDIRVNNTDGGQIWSRPLQNNFWSVILYNSNVVYGDVSITLTFSSANFPGWPEHVTSANVRDIWQHKDLPVTSSMQVNLTPHESVMFKVSPAQ
uniref:Alpha-galactosidase n=1 Tax=Arcella intermedia TaxID=1963864 RepID=A0A6B2L6E6_9EUKA